MDPWGWIDRTSYEFFGFVLVEYVVRGNRRPVTVLSYAVIKSTYGETRVLCLSLVPSKVIAFFYGLSRELRDISALLGCIDLIAFNIFDVSDATYTPETHFSTDKLQGNDLKIVWSMIDSEKRLFRTNFEKRIFVTREKGKRYEKVSRKGIFSSMRTTCYERYANT